MHAWRKPYERGQTKNLVCSNCGATTPPFPLFLSPRERTCERETLRENEKERMKRRMREWEGRKESDKEENRRRVWKAVSHTHTHIQSEAQESPGESHASFANDDFWMLWYLPNFLYHLLSWSSCVLSAAICEESMCMCVYENFCVYVCRLINILHDSSHGGSSSLSWR